jgi:hypothetical protein
MTSRRESANKVLGRGDAVPEQVVRARVLTRQRAGADVGCCAPTIVAVAAIIGRG